MPKTKRSSDLRSYNWVIIIYYEHAFNIEKRIQKLGLCGLLSPVHDEDLNADGTHKKPHYHFLMHFPTKKSLAQIQAISDEFSGVRVLYDECAVRDIRAMCRYLVHKDNPEKFQYEISDLKTFGGFDYQKYFTGSDDVDLILQEIMEFCKDNNLTSLARLSQYSARYRKDWFRVISAKRTRFLLAYLQSLQWELNTGMSDDENLCVNA